MTFLQNISSALNRIHFHNLQTEVIREEFSAVLETSLVDSATAYDLKIAVRYCQTDSKYFRRSSVLFLSPDKGLPSNVEFDLYPGNPFNSDGRVDMKKAHTFIHLEIEKVKETMLDFLKFFSKDWQEADDFEYVLLDAVLKENNEELDTTDITLLVHHEKHSSGSRTLSALKRLIKKFKLIHLVTEPLVVNSGIYPETVWMYGKDEILMKFQQFLEDETKTTLPSLLQLAMNYIALNVDRYKNLLDDFPWHLRAQIDLRIPMSIRDTIEI
jgi:hypothetical protein